VVVVDERDLRSDPRRWSVVVEKPREVAGITEAEARDWLARYRSAFERNDKGTLLALGVFSTPEEAERACKGWGPRTVTTRNESIDRQGQFASVSFNRTDRDHQSGKDVEYPARLVYRLEKGSEGVRAVRR
jgi:hypothetical protein